MRKNWKVTMKKIFILLLTIVMFSCLFLIVGCNPTTDFSGTKVVFELEGGNYQNATRPVVFYYQFEEGAPRLIKELSELSEQDLDRAGYDLVGWFTTKKTDSSGNVTYEDQWDFAKDEVGEDGITLYACWQIKAEYTYEVYDFNDFDNSEALPIITKTVGVGSTFSERYATRPGYTLIALYDENKQPWDPSFKHPGGETDCAIKVYAQYIEGTYTVVRTASELTLASTRNANIYLAADIDMDGKALSFGNFKKELLGNGHTISNFSVSYSVGRDDLIEDFDDPSKKSLTISLFGNTDGAKVIDVNFEDVSINVGTTYKDTYKIYVAPIAVSATDTEISNVTFKGTVTIVNLPSEIDADRSRLIIEETNAVCFKDDSTKIDGFSSEITLI